MEKPVACKNIEEIGSIGLPDAVAPRIDQCLDSSYKATISMRKNVGAVKNAGSTRVLWRGGNTKERHWGRNVCFSGIVAIGNIMPRVVECGWRKESAAAVKG